VIRRFRRRLLEQAEREPTDTLIDEVVRHFLYAPRPGDPTPNDPNPTAGPDGAAPDGTAAATPPSEATAAPNPAPNPAPTAAPAPAPATAPSATVSPVEADALAANVDVLPLLEAAETHGKDVWVGMLQRWVLQVRGLGVSALEAFRNGLVVEMGGGGHVDVDWHECGCYRCEVRSVHPPARLSPPILTSPPDPPDLLLPSLTLPLLPSLS
jgi:hypothetical protein